MLEQSLIAHMPLLIATSVLRLREDGRVILNSVTCIVLVP